MIRRSHDRAGQLLRALALLLLAAAGVAARAQTYVADNSPAVAAAYPWIDISASGTAVALSDDQVSGAIALGFTFTYGATAYTQLRVGSNGMLFFGGTSTEYSNSPLPLNGAWGAPNIDAVMLPLWDDLQPNHIGTYIRVQTLGSAPNRVFVASWLAVPYYCYNSGSTCNSGNQQTKLAFATFQVQIYEQGQFVYRYGPVDGQGGAHSPGPVLSNPAGATIGYELTNGDYVQFSFENASVPDGSAILWSQPGAAPGGFNAFDTSVPAGSITGSIHTKVAGSGFSLAVVALNGTRSAPATGFSGDVKVELLDAGDNSGALNATTGCRSSWTSVLQTATLSFTAADGGRKNIAFTEANAWRDVRVRMSYPATGSASVVACSTDDFAIRPSAFAGFAVTDGDSASAGTARALANTGASGGNVHRAGRPFTVHATAVNAASAITTNYNGAPTAAMSACASAGCGAGLGSLSVALSAAAGVIDDNTATYGEAGAFTLQLVDTSFASVDGADGSSAAEITISSPAIPVGRFVPDHFDVTLLVAPVLRTFGSAGCAARSFTYVGQPFGYAVAPQATVLARNAAGATTANYAGALWKLTAAGVTQTYGPLAPASPGLDVSGIGAPTLASNGDGTGVLAAGASDSLRFVRPAAAPLAPFNAAITLAWSAVDSSESAVAGNGSIAASAGLTFGAIAFDAGNLFRYGVLRLANAYGSELNNLPVTVEAQYWNGAAFATNGADQCTALPTGSVAMANYQRNLAACETRIAPATVVLSSGRGFFTLAKPGAGNNGSVDLALQLGTSASGQTCAGAAATPAVAAGLPWLQGRWSGAAAYDRNPAARASFGQYRSPLIYLRERY